METSLFKTKQNQFTITPQNIQTTIPKLNHQSYVDMHIVTQEKKNKLILNSARNLGLQQLRRNFHWNWTLQRRQLKPVRLAKPNTVI